MTQSPEARLRGLLEATDKALQLASQADRGRPDATTLKEEFGRWACSRAGRLQPVVLRRFAFHMGRCFAHEDQPERRAHYPSVGLVDWTDP